MDGRSGERRHPPGVTVTRTGREAGKGRPDREEQKPFYGIDDPPGLTPPGNLERWLKKRGVNLWGGKGARRPRP